MLPSGMRSLLALIVFMMSPLSAQVSGRANVQLWLAQSEVQPGQSVAAAIRMVYEKDWHGYWVNPGESGMVTEVEWKLPTGWKASPLQFPLPHRMITGGLVSYGYAGEILLPFTLVAPAEMSGPQIIEGTVTWLACNDKSCVSGEATVKATIAPGNGAAGPHANAITTAMNAIPTKNQRLQLTVIEDAGKIDLVIKNAPNHTQKLELTDAEIFPITEQALDPRERMLLKKNDAGYIVSAKKNEYATEPLAQLELLIVPSDGTPSFTVEWKNK